MTIGSKVKLTRRNKFRQHNKPGSAGLIYFWIRFLD